MSAGSNSVATDHFNMFVKYRQHLPDDLKRRVKLARLFDFDLAPTQALDGMAPEEVGEAAYNLVLPFPVVAVQDRVSCVIVWDLQVGAVGSDIERGVLEVVDLWNYGVAGAFRQSTQDPPGTQEAFDEHTQWVRSNFTPQNSPIGLRWGVGGTGWAAGVKKWAPKYRCESALIIDRKSGQVTDLVKAYGSDQRLQVDFTRSALTAIEELTRLSRPHTFILEDRPPEPKQRKHASDYRLAAERPRYAVLEPDVIRKRTGMVSPVPEKRGRTIRERRAHIRREHDRVKQDEEYWGPEEVGKVMHVRRAYVRAIWNGDFEAEKEGHKYRVILDLPKALKDSCGKEE